MKIPGAEIPATEEELREIHDPQVKRRLRARATRYLKRGWVGNALWLYQKLLQSYLDEGDASKHEGLRKAIQDVEKLRAYGSNKVAVELLRDVIKVADEVKYRRRDELFRKLVDYWLSAINFEIRRTLYFYEEGYIWVHHDRPNLKARMQGFFDYNLDTLKLMFTKMFADIYAATLREPSRRYILPELEERVAKLQEMIFYLGDVAFMKKMKKMIEGWMDKLRAVGSERR